MTIEEQLLEVYSLQDDITHLIELSPTSENMDAVRIKRSELRKLCQKIARDYHGLEALLTNARRISSNLNMMLVANG